MDLAAVLRAHTLLAEHLPPTPMWAYPALDDVVGATVLVKHENVQPTGAFKVRGGLVLLAALGPAERSRGVITYSTGNHAQSIAYAARAFGVRCTVVMPEAANPAKVRACEALGARVACKGADLDEAAGFAGEVAAAEGLRLITPAGDEALLAGVATAYLEVLRARPDLDALIVPIGSGTGAAGACTVAAALAPRCEVIGVQSAASPAAHDSWRLGRCVRRPNRTVVDGLATGHGCELPQAILREQLADFVLVADEQIATARRLLATHAHTLAEGAGAASLAAVLTAPARFAGRTVAVVCSGGNAGPAELADLAGA